MNRIISKNILNVSDFFVSKNYIAIYFQENDYAFLVYLQIDEEDKEKWDYKAFSCSPFPTALLLGIAAGTTLAIIISIAIAVVVFINLRDLREYKRFVKDQREAKRLMANTKPNIMFENARMLEKQN